MHTPLKAALIVCSALLAGCAPAMQPVTLAAPGRVSVPLPAGDVGAGTLKLSSPQFSDGSTIPMEQVGSSLIDDQGSALALAPARARLYQ